MQTTFAYRVYAGVRPKLMMQVERIVRWFDSVSKKDPSFVGMMKVYVDKTATTLKSRETVAHYVHVIFSQYK